MIVPYQRGATIAALATPPGEGAIAIVRISGPLALTVTECIYSGPVKTYKSHTAHVGKIVDRQGKILDQVLLIPFLAPHSYTGEDLVEIHCHGGSLLSRTILERVIEAGARMALPGEFTFQAFSNGKLDLAQAEAVQQLIGSKNDLARIAANHQLEGALSKTIRSFQTALTRYAAILEAWIDFPEEGLETLSREEMVSHLTHILNEMNKLASSFTQGRMLHTGVTLCLLGTPNVGKSSLMNALLGFERAIVTNIAGTTRDLLEEPLRLGSLHVRLIDTAGIRDTQEHVEQQGVIRSRQAMERADLILLLLDASRPLNEEDRALLASVPKGRTLIIWNKIDLGQPTESLEWDHVVCLSAKERIGLDLLQNALERIIWRTGPPNQEEVLLTSLRHFEALNQAVTCLTKVIEGLNSSLSPEFISFEMRTALHHLGSIIGTNVTEEVLNSLFAQFCLGK